MNRTTFTTPALLVLLAIILAACPSDQGASASASAAAAAPSEATIETPPPDDGDETGADASLSPGAGDFEGVLPDEVGGIAIDYESASGQEAVASEDLEPEVIEFFDNIGADPSGVSTAAGFGSDTETGEFIFIFAFRVSGADEDRLLDEFRATLEEEDQTLTEASVAGKDVLVTEEDETGSTGYLYARGDTVFLVGATSEDLATEALSQLP